MFFDTPELRAVVEWWHMEDRVKGHAPAEFAAVLDAAGVDKVLCPSIKMGSFRQRSLMLGLKDEDVYALTQALPDRVYGLCGINPTERMAGVARLERAVREYGFVGAHLHIYGFDLPINHRDLWPFYAKCAELDVPVVMQVGHSAESMPSAHARPILLDDVALYFPELRIVAAHTGWPWVEELIAIAWKHANVYIGTTAHFPKYWDPALVQFLSTRGRGKVLYGTDYPVMTHAESMAAIAAMNLKDAAREELLFAAATRVFRL